LSVFGVDDIEQFLFDNVITNSVHSSKDHYIKKNTLHFSFLHTNLHIC